MRNTATGDKIIVKRNGNGHYIYFPSGSGPTTAPSLISFRTGKGRDVNRFRRSGTDLRREIGRPAPPLPLFQPLEKNIQGPAEG
jgi:hypothetical protein